MRKQFLSLLLISTTLSLIGSTVPANAQETIYVDTRIVNKSLAVGRKTSKKADSSAILHLCDTGATKGFLPPVTDTGKIVRPAFGLQIVNRSDSACYYYNGKRWKKIGS